MSKNIILLRPDIFKRNRILVAAVIKIELN